MTDRVFNVLFLCTGKSVRSILAESILRKNGGERFNAYSAGSHPKGRVNPFALKTLEAYGYPAMDFARRAGKSSPRRTLRNSISCSRSATARRAKPVRYGWVCR